MHTLTRVINFCIDMSSLLRRKFSRKMIFRELESELPPSKKHVLQLARSIYETYSITEFVGSYWRDGNGKSDHERGLALDIIANSYPFRPQGKKLAEMHEIVTFLLAHKESAKIKYIVWQNQIIESPNWEWKQNIKSPRNRSASELHDNHIHISFFE